MERACEVDDKPLSARDEEREQRKFDKAGAKRRDEGPGERQKRLAEKEKRQEAERKMVAGVIRAGDFSLAGGESTRM